MHTPSLKIEEDNEFPKVLTAKQLPGKDRNRTTREIGITATNSSGLKPGQGVLPSELQTLHYHLGDMHNLTPKILGGLVFQR
jgi:hypothetical protein